MNSDRGPTPRAAAVQRFFAANLELFETIELVGVPSDDRAAAEALCRELHEGSRELPVGIPADPEILEEPAESGYFGVVTRADLPPEFSEALFRDGAGEIVGPVAYAGRFWVFRILLPRRAVLNQEVYDYCESLVESSGGT
jgi:hypothetical protein